MPTTPSLTITSYNIHKGMSALNRKVVVQGIASALQALGAHMRPDILCLQEVQGQHLKRAIKFNEFPDQAQHEWFGEYLACQPYYEKNCTYPHGHHGNAVLSRHPLDPKHNVNITVSRLETRGVLHCEIMPTGWDTSIVVLCAHLNLLEKDRTKQYQIISEYIQDGIDAEQPLILAGDLNDWLRLSSKKLGKRLAMYEAFLATGQSLPRTFPARLPLLSLDRIYVRNLVVEQAWVHQGAPWSHLSDHLPVSARVRLG